MSINTQITFLVERTFHRENWNSCLRTPLETPSHFFQITKASEANRLKESDHQAKLTNVGTYES